MARPAQPPNQDYACSESYAERIRRENAKAEVFRVLSETHVNGIIRLILEAHLAGIMHERNRILGALPNVHHKPDPETSR